MSRLHAWAVGRRPVAIAWLAPARVGHRRVVSSSGRPSGDAGGGASSKPTSHGSCRRRSMTRVSWNDSAIAAIASRPT